MNNKLILRTLTSPFATPYNDITKGSVLSQADLDNNQIYLKGETIYSAITNGGTTTLKKLNGNDLVFINTGGGSGGGDSLWITGSTGNFSLKAINDSGLDATGNYSLAEGGITLASGDYSHAEGAYTTASRSEERRVGKECR